MNRTIKDKIRCLTNQNKNDWDLKIFQILTNIRNMPTVKNQQSPAELLFGRFLSLPFIIILTNNSRKASIHSAKSNQPKYQSRVKRNFDKHVPKQRTFHSPVFKRNNSVTPGKLNGLADTLSRIHVIASINDSMGIRYAQQLDSEFIQMKEFLANGDSHQNPSLQNSTLWTLRNRLYIADNLICYRRDEFLLVIVLSSKHMGVLKAAHEDFGAGAVERLNQDIINMLRIRCNGKLEPTWDENLPELLIVLRNRRKASTNKSPFQMLFGRNLHVPWHIKQIDEVNDLQIKNTSQVDNDDQKYRQGMSSYYNKAVPKYISNWSRHYRANDPKINKLDDRYRKWDTPYISVTIPLEEEIAQYIEENKDQPHHSKRISKKPNKFDDFEMYHIQSENLFADSSHPNLIENFAETHSDLNSNSNNYVDFDYDFDDSSHLNLIEKCAETNADLDINSNNYIDFNYDFDDSSHLNLIKKCAETNSDLESNSNKVCGQNVPDCALFIK
ncbi:hypothetical protein A3Q56_04700 [Intoshia linei]|uniref:Uncharacterized protein n=1 Tax=Intoshia linei TaxID=1819745 RepID=A0A177B1N9_9BILA|nr:hypothetical protein A3Q56_04700 [Intoshia linei]